MNSAAETAVQWPEMNWAEWGDTADTLHMWTQIVGKTRLALTPLQRHWWNVPLYVSACGLTTSAIPYGSEMLEIEFDFPSHLLHFRLSTGASLSTPLRAQSVADFYQEYQRSLKAMGIEVAIHAVPVELKAPIPFAEDTQHASYDPAAAHRFWRILIRCSRIFQEFSSRFMGKISPVHFFWGSFDLAVTRFSGRVAPPRFGKDFVMSEAYSREVISAGFWPGNGGFGEAAFYCYAAPSPAGLEQAKIEPAPAGWNKDIGEFIFRYEDMRKLASPDDALLAFLQSSYDAAAELAQWDRALLDRPA